MKANNKPQEDLMAIRNMMERSSKYLSLSGLSGVFAGCCALTGAAIAYYFMFDAGNIKLNYFPTNNAVDSSNSLQINLLITAIVVLITAFSGAVYFSYRKAKRNRLQFWNKTTKQLLTHLFIPLVAGGLFSLILIFQNNIHLVAATTLIFYGLALVNAGKYTFGEIHYLGLSEIVLGLLAGLFINFGLLFWTLGFGVLHIVYGLAMYRKYEK